MCTLLLQSAHIFVLTYRCAHIFYSLAPENPGSRAYALAGVRTYALLADWRSRPAIKGEGDGCRGGVGLGGGSGWDQVGGGSRGEDGGREMEADVSVMADQDGVVHRLAQLGRGPPEANHGPAQHLPAVVA